MKRKGFTLIELLAVIVILAIIALIAVPLVINIIKNADKNAFKDSAYGIIKAGELYYSSKNMDLGELKDTAFTFPDNLEGLDIKGSVPSSGEMFVYKTGEVSLAISNGKYCASKGKNDDEIKIDEDTSNCNIVKLISADFEKDTVALRQLLAFTFVTNMDATEISIIDRTRNEAIYGEVSLEIDKENNRKIWTGYVKPTMISSREYKFYAKGIDLKKYGPIIKTITVTTS